MEAQKVFSGSLIQCQEFVRANRFNVLLQNMTIAEVAPGKCEVKAHLTEQCRQTEPKP